jgi:UDP-GlcNAc3NAcA epimerase
MKILTLLGARPQFIKAAVISRCIRDQYASTIQEEIIHTGQHYDYNMSQVFFDEMDIPEANVNLNVQSNSHGSATAKMLEAIEKEIIARDPDCILVYGDTNSTLAGALAAAKLYVPIVHIEAGERSYNRKMPEEINRVLTDHLSSLLFCCSSAACDRLEKEGITKNVFIVGDIMLDAFLTYRPKAILPNMLNKKLSSFVLATVHRAQNTDNLERLKTIFSAFSDIPEHIIFPLHPRTLKNIQAANISIANNIHLLQPVSYFEILGLLKECEYVLTDSGGLQKEAYYAEKKCIILRDETEWTELVEAGVNKISGVDKNGIAMAAAWAKKSIHFKKNIYGDGNAGEKILTHLKQVIHSNY